MANEDDLPQVQACAIRVTDLDASGVPLPGTDTMYVTDSFTELGFTNVYTDGTEIEETTACGSTAYSYRPPDSFKRGDVTLTLITHDPILMAKLSQGDVLTDSGINGWAAPPIGPLTGNGVSIELWAKRIDAGDLHPEWPYAWWVLPKVKNLRLNTKTFNNGQSNPQFSGQALENVNWFDGPTNDWPVASDRVIQWFPAAALPALTGATDLVAS